MDEENNENVEQVVEEVNTVNETGKSANAATNFIKTKWMMIAGIVVAIIAVIAVILGISGGKTKAIKKYLSGFSSRNSSKIIDSLDIAGVAAWEGLYLYDAEDFEKEDYEDFIENYKEASNNKDELKETKKEAKESLDDLFDDIKSEYKTYKITLKKVNETKKLGKDLLLLDVELKLTAKSKDGKEESDTATATFVTYKGKIVNPSLGM